MAEANSTPLKSCARCLGEFPKDDEFFYRVHGAPHRFQPYCKKCKAQYNAEWKKQNPSSVRSSHKANYERHKEEKKQKAREYKRRNREMVKAGALALRSRPAYSVGANISRRISRALQGAKARRSWQQLVGYSTEELRLHLEKQFCKRMSWENYGKFWHVDHITPVSAFDQDQPDWIRSCWALANLRPLPAGENTSKRDKILFLV